MNLLRIHVSDPSVAENTVIHGALPAANDTATALEDLFDQVWKCEREASMLDRIDLALSLAGGRTTDHRTEEGRR